MTQNVIERAFELASRSRYRDVNELGDKLVKEGFDDAHAHISGAGIRRQLRQVMLQRRRSEGRTG